MKGCLLLLLTISVFALSDVNVCTDVSGKAMEVTCKSIHVFERRRALEITRALAAQCMDVVDSEPDKEGYNFALARFCNALDSWTLPNVFGEQDECEQDEYEKVYHSCIGDDDCYKDMQTRYRVASDILFRWNIDCSDIDVYSRTEPFKNGLCNRIRNYFYDYYRFASLVMRY
jgi:hypothetical protein